MTRHRIRAAIVGSGNIAGLTHVPALRASATGSSSAGQDPTAATLSSSR
jgi:predicted dehydrogenase